MLPEACDLNCPQLNDPTIDCDATHYRVCYGNKQLQILTSAAQSGLLWLFGSLCYILSVKATNPQCAACRAKCSICSRCVLASPAAPFVVA